MDAAAHNPAFAKKAGVPVSVAKDFSKASKGAKFGGSGTRADSQVVNRPDTNQGKSELFSKGGYMKESKAMVKKEIGFMKKAGAPKSMIKHEKVEMGMKSGGMHKMPDGKMMKNSAMKMASGGMPMVMKDGKKVPAFAADGEGKMKHGGMTKKMMGGGMAKTVMPGSRSAPTPVGPGSNSRVLPRGGTPFGGNMERKPMTPFGGSMERKPMPGSRDTLMAKGGGIESKGKTKGTMIKMKSGGRAC
jgi:hypothetical protein